MSKPLDRDDILDWVNQNAIKMPATMKLRIKPNYDETVLEWRGGKKGKRGKHKKIRNYIKFAVTHAQVRFCHDSLGTKMKLALRQPKFHKGVFWNDAGHALATPHEYDERIGNALLLSI